MLYSTILAGGSGTRLWPLSRACEPKFLHALTGTDRSLLQATADRVGPLSATDQIYVVTGTAHAAAISRQLPEVPAANILIEPSPKDSCAAVSLACAVLARRDPGAVMAAFSADHLIGDQDRFVEIIEQAAAAARDGYLTTVGIRPSHAEVRFGYLRLGAPAAGHARAVAEFKEKPSLEVAANYVESGQYLWNAGIFVFGVDAFLAELARQRPQLSDGIARIADAWDGPERDATLAEVWPGLEKISVDYGVLEGAAAAGKVATVPADMPWSDVGDFDSLGRSLPTDESGNLLIASQAEIVARDVKDAVIVSTTDRVVAVVGLDDVVVVDTADATLVCARSRSQEVKQIVEELRDRGHAGRL
ncbi:MAG TPA: mannose-1-phosphate guanylyltransferase [Streptosporangiaceae bacterium]|nr:mannose-1-phosphate guanylyltransferase [Streptosporangiaceae bacterium]